MEQQNNITLQKTTLKDLDPNLSNVLIVGIIIGKQRPKKFPNQTPGDSNPFKAVWNFTLRDSPRDYINVTYWGPSDLILETNDKFHTGDTVEIINPLITIRKVNDYGEKFRPMVTSPYALSLNEKSEIRQHPGNNSYYRNFLNLPTKPLAGFVPLRDIHNNGASMTDVSFDVLGAVRFIGTIRNVTTKNGDVIPVRQVEVFDHTAPSLKITIWDPQIIIRSNMWKPRYTIVFFTDLVTEWSNFEWSYTAKVTNRTIVTENPTGAEAMNLLKFAKTSPIDTSDLVEQLYNSLPDPRTIQNVMSIKQVQDKINILVQETQSTNRQFTGLLFAFVSQMDLDGLSKTLSIKCDHCKMPMKTDSHCENAECPVSFGKQPLNPEIVFDLRIILSDHTGSLMNCRLSGNAAESTFECTAQEFSRMTDSQKCALKWKFLMERCAIRIAVIVARRNNPIITILSCSLANDAEIVQRLPVY